MFPSQSNTIPGTSARPYNSGEALTGMEGRLVKIVDGGSIPEAKLPETAADLALFICVDGGALDTDSELLPLVPGQEYRVRAKGAGSAGGVIVLAAIAGADAGKARALPATEGQYFSPGVALDDFADGDLVKFTALPRLVTVASTVAAPAATTTVDGAIAALNSTAVNPTKADFDALLTAVEKIADEQRADNAKLIAIHTALAAAGILKIA